MTERPILFSAPMVRAILAGRKTQTRRLLRPLDAEWVWRLEEQDAAISYSETGHGGAGWYAHCAEYPDEGSHFMRCPYGESRDRLWVKETYALHRIHDDTRPSRVQPTLLGAVAYRADDGLSDGFGRWRPSIHMPRWASRITLEVTGVRVERLQEIGEDDARAEGVTWARGAMGQMVPGPPTCARDAFSLLWDSINAERAPWESNPWVWVVEFRRSTS